MIEGTERSNMQAVLETLQANSGFSTLQAMRDSSKTGGALGAINAKEMGLLTAALGNISLSQSKEQFDQSLANFEKVYYDTVNGFGAWAKKSKEAPQEEAAPVSISYSYDPATGAMVQDK